MSGNLMFQIAYIMEIVLIKLIMIEWADTGLIMMEWADYDGWADTGLLGGSIPGSWVGLESGWN